MENFDDKYKKKNPFTVPDGYFDNLTERLMKRVGEEEKAKKKSVMRFFRHLWVGLQFLCQGWL